MHCNVSNLHHRPLCVVGVYALHSLNVENIQGGSQKLVTVIFTITLANVDQFLGERYYVTLRSPYVIANPHVLCLSVCRLYVCHVGAPHSELNILAMFLHRLIG